MVDPAPLRVRDIPFNFQAEDPRDGLIYNVFSATGGGETAYYFSKLEGRIDLGPFFPIYCLNPPKDDGCPLGICPNPDIDGLLVRIARTPLVSFLQRTAVYPTFVHQITSQRSV